MGIRILMTNGKRKKKEQTMVETRCQVHRKRHGSLDYLVGYISNKKNGVTLVNRVKPEH